MDPNTTLQRIILAAMVGDSDDLREASDDLATWLDQGGFRPIMAELEAWTRTR